MQSFKSKVLDEFIIGHIEIVVLNKLTRVAKMTIASILNFHGSIQLVSTSFDLYRVYRYLSEIAQLFISGSFNKQ